MFHKLKKKKEKKEVVKLEEVLRCSNEICRISKFTQIFVRNKDSVYYCLSNCLTVRNIIQFHK